MGVEYTVYCDECGDIIDSAGNSPGHTRRQAKEHGILFRLRRRDLCATCYRREVAAADQPQPRPTGRP